MRDPWLIATPAGSGEGIHAATLPAKERERAGRNRVVEAAHRARPKTVAPVGHRSRFNELENEGARTKPLESNESRIGSPMAPAQKP